MWEEFPELEGVLHQAEFPCRSEFFVFAKPFGGEKFPKGRRKLPLRNEATNAQGGTLQLKIRGGGWLDILGSEILVGKDILGFLKNIDLDNSLIHTDS